jgi:hypothetical protein
MSLDRFVMALSFAAARPAHTVFLAIPGRKPEAARPYRIATW